MSMDNVRREEIWEGKELGVRQERTLLFSRWKSLRTCAVYIGRWTGLTWSFPARNLEHFCEVLFI